MRQVTRKGLTIVAAAGGVLALGGGIASAHNGGAGAWGAASHSPGVASGNTVQVPVDVPVNACGNTVNVVGALNPSFGNKCVNKGSGAKAEGATSNSPGVASGNNVQAPVHVPVNACGNSVDVVGVLNPAFGNECGTGHKPGKPEQPGKPEKPDNPHEPDNPEEPEEPNHPGHPEEPDNPDEPNHPNEPQEPGEPGNPHEPNHPNRPHEPGNPGEPGSPEGPNNPGPQGDTPHGPGDQLASTGAAPLEMLIPAGAGLLLGGAVLYRRSRRAARSV
ncbi:chaplin [Streptomyces pyxinae]|uniref:chaplin n=1 Tax=Streptomyces pyxinae TaxID=2970734 RepID=UPI002867C272|nr:chaplin family protein [Streptomyces sp. LP05-1]